MSQWILNAKIFFLVVFFIACAAMFGYEARYIWPMKKCEESGAWWDARDRQCLTPMPIWRITGRQLPRPPAPSGQPAPPPAKP